MDTDYTAGSWVSIGIRDLDERVSLRYDKLVDIILLTPTYSLAWEDELVGECITNYGRSE